MENQSVNRLHTSRGRHLTNSWRGFTAAKLYRPQPPYNTVLGGMKSLMVFLTIATLVGCAETGPSISFELEYLENDDVKSWVGVHNSKLTEAWGEPLNSEQQGGLTKLSYLITNNLYDEAISNVESQDWQSGPQTEGIDNDMAKTIRLTMTNSCTVEFRIDDASKVVEASIFRFKGANECDSSQIYNAKAKRDDA